MASTPSRRTPDKGSSAQNATRVSRSAEALSIGLCHVSPWRSSAARPPPAERVFDQELLNWSAESGQPINPRLHGIQIRLQHARAITADRKSTAVALALDALKELEFLAQYGSRTSL
jgi:hypothetical protein